MIFLLRSLWYLLWRSWFYILVTLPIIIFFPVLLVLSSRESWYPQFFWVARNLWAPVILYGMGFVPHVRTEGQRMQRRKSYMLIANHTSMSDIMLMLRASKQPFVFVGKKELASLPVFGFFYKRVCILVDRSNAKSRKEAYDKAKARLNNGLSICIFPEGGVPDTSVFLDEFKDGAFRLAIEYQIPIVPMTFGDNKQRLPFSFFSGTPGKMRVMIHRFIETGGLTIKDKVALKQKAREVIYRQLKVFRKEKAV